jgi:DNA mismatch repair ATPase MutS
MNFFDNRLNMVVSIFLNGLFLWDIQCVLWLEKWKIKNRQQTGKWFDAIYRFDALQCLGNFSFNNPGYAFPAVEDEGPVIEAEKLGHPLIDKAERVSNDFKQGKNGEIYLITGANMAGKSTFLRTVGINLVLARAGAPACAEKFNCQPREIFTSMRTSDSLKKNESYFYAELLRMKKLFQQLESPLKTYFILDEMLKGTNSADKLTGSGKLIREMIRLKGTGIIATHDLQLANLEEEYPGVIINRCFEIEIDNSNIIFDYKLKKGVTTKMNAMLLIDQMGLTGRKSI